MAAKKQEKKLVPSDIPSWVKKLPKGFSAIYNRLPFDFSITFDGNVETWEPNEFRMVQHDLARFCERRGMHRWDPMGAKTVMALVDERHQYFGVPLPDDTEQAPEEVLIRNKGLDAPASEVTSVEVPE